MKPIAEWLTKPVYFEIGGKRWPIVFTHRVLLACEELTGIDMLSENMTKPSAALLRALLFLALDRAGFQFIDTWTPGVAKRIGIEGAGRLIDRRNLGAVRSTVTEAWSAAMPDPEPDMPETKNTKNTKKVAWLDAWAAARQELGLAADEWLDMTPRMVRALSANRLENIRDREFMESRAIAMNANFSYCAPKKAFRHDQFMMHPWPAGESEPEEPITGEHIASVLAAATGKG